MTPFPGPDDPLARAVVEGVAFVAVAAAAVVLAALAVCAGLRRGRDERLVWRAVPPVILVLLAFELFGGGRLLAPRVVAPAAPESARVTPVRSTAPLATPSPPGEARVMVPIPAGPRPSSADPFVRGLALTWAVGSCTLFVGLVVAHGLLALMRRRLAPTGDAEFDGRVRELARAVGLTGPIRFGRRPGVRSPFVFGPWRPTLVWPATWPEGLTARHRDALLVHELAHLASRDPFWSLVADLAVIALWWHPAAWVARARLRRATERAADEATVALPDGPLALAECLLEFLRTPTAPAWRPGLAAATPRSDVGRRIVRLADGLPVGPGRSRMSRWVRSGLPLVAAVIVTAGSAGARFHNEPEDRTMTTRTLLRGSLLGLAAVALSDATAPAQSRVAGPAVAAGPAPGVAAAGKSEEGAAAAVGLSRADLKSFLALKEERTEKTAAFHKIKDAAERREAGLAIGKWWRTSLQELLGEEQYSRYLEYWDTNNVVIRFDPEEKGAYLVTVTAHPFDAPSKLQDGLKLTQRQTQKVEALRAKLAKSLAEAQALAKTPEGLARVTDLVARSQRERNEALKVILTEAQYTGYRRSLDELVAAQTSSRGAVRMAAPVKP